jgi:myo-inositol-1(or 4)-monophosphatase
MQIEEFLTETARGAGEIIRSHFGKVKSRRSKGDRGDIVTEVDIESESYVLGRIRDAFPDHNIISEEAGSIDNKGSFTWLVDPLDGTRNYSLGIPFFGVSLALIKDGVAQYGVIYDPTHDEMFFAARGHGATLNGVRMQVSGETDMDDAIISISWLRRMVDHSQFVGYVDKVSRQTSYLRRLGSAALVCAYVAAGRLDAYMQGSINAWDIAAGSLLVEEAGGTVTDFEGCPLDLSRPQTDILAASPALHKKLMEEIIHSS